LAENANDNNKLAAKNAMQFIKFAKFDFIGINNNAIFINIIEKYIKNNTESIKKNNIDKPSMVLSYHKNRKDN